MKAKSFVIFATIAIGMLLTVGFASAESIEKDGAIEILMEDIIKPSNASDRLGAYMLSEPLQQGDVVSSESGQEYVIENNTWFIFIDDEPCAMFEHPVRYAFINATTGNYTVADEIWPPMINNVSMWDTKTLGRGELIEIYSTLSEPVPITGTQTTAPSGDYGDAPDGQDAYYGVNGSFPTLFNTTNSKFGRPGAHALNVGQEMLGVNVSAEVDANDPYDPDGVPNLVDADSDERMFVIIENATAKLAFDVTVNASAPNVTRYVNVLIDFDQSGNWSGAANGTEWAVVNMDVNVSPRTTETIITQNFSWGINNVSPVWTRVSLTREQVNETLFGAEGWDGSGQFEYGEIEDSLVFLMDCPPISDAPNWWSWWPPWPGFPPGGQPPQKIHPKPEPPKAQPPGPITQPCGDPINYYYVIINCGDNSKSSHMKPECDQLEKLFKDQKYNDGEYLEPDDGTNTANNIETRLKALRKNVTCVDRILVYIKGHGWPDQSGINLRDKDKKLIGKITPKDINDWLDIPACPGKLCDVKHESCFVDVVIDSCHAGGFLKNVADPKKPGLAREGRTVAVSGNDKYSLGGARGYAVGFIKDMRSAASDTDPKDGYVTVKEAHKTAVAHQKKYDPVPDPDISPQQCNCTSPIIDVNKTVWNPATGKWERSRAAKVCDNLTFNCTIHAKCCNLTNITVTDVLSCSLNYTNNATVYYPNGTKEKIEPEVSYYPCNNTTLKWFFPGPLNKSETLTITFDAHKVKPYCDNNTQNVTAWCNETNKWVTGTSNTVNIFDINVNKTVWDPGTKKWVESRVAKVCDNLTFNCTIHPKCCNLTNITVTDILSCSLNYTNNATVHYPNGTIAKIEPEVSYYPCNNTTLKWFFPGPLNKSETLTIIFDAHKKLEGCDNNTQIIEGKACNKTWVTVKSNTVDIFDINVNKTVWDPGTKKWVESRAAKVSEDLTFNCTIHPKCCNLTNIEVIDILSKSLNYTGTQEITVDNVTINVNTIVVPGPDDTTYVAWIPPPAFKLKKCQTMTIIFDAHKKLEGCDKNTQIIKGKACNKTWIMVKSNTVDIFETKDFGDAPDKPYPSKLSSNGARHSVFAFEWLGEDVNGELDSKQVDLDEFDDGVTFYPPYKKGVQNKVDVLITTSGLGAARYGAAANKKIYLNAWFDWNGNGNWEAGELTISQAYDPSTWGGANSKKVTINFIPPVDQPLKMWARFRLDYGENVKTPTGQAKFGEVEDYYSYPEEPALTPLSFLLALLFLLGLGAIAMRKMYRR